MIAALPSLNPISAQEVQEKKISIEATLTIAEAFAQIEKQTGHSIAYGQSKIDTKKKITLSLKGASLDEAMTGVLKSTGLTYKLNGYHIILIPKPQEPEQAPQPRRNVTISGRVTDSATGEVIIGSTVYDRLSNKGTTTNAYGFYSLTLPEGRIDLTCSFLGYTPFEKETNLTKDTRLDITLDTATTTLEAVVVVPEDHNPLTSNVGATNIPIARIKASPALLGESDLMKSLQYIPGVQGAAEGKADLSVRGGSPDQNLILLDGNPIYNVGHLFGFVSVFNTDALKNVTLYKSGFPARFGGRLSSVIDINTKDGNKERFDGSATLGLLAAKFNVEGPIVKGRTSFTLSGRRSWTDAIMRLAQRGSEKTFVSFYDINAKLHHKISDRTSFYLTAYNGRDRLRNSWERSSLNWQWGNTIVAARLNSALSGNLFMNANLSYNRYGYYNGVVYEQKGEPTQRIDYNSGIRDYTATVELEYIPDPTHYIRAGIQGVVHDFRPETLSISGDQEMKLAGGKIPAGEVSLYAEDEWDVTRRLTLNGGFRASTFSVGGKTYGGIDPRLSARYRFSDRITVKASYARMQQYIHLLSNNSLLFQTDLWVPTTDKVKPMNSTQYSLGAYIAFPRLFDLSVEGYYKNMNNVIEYKDGASFDGHSSGWENKVEAGIGRAYGFEVSLERRVGTTTGSLSYAWSKSKRRFTEINYGKWFPARYDRRHTVNATVTQRISKKVDMTASWTYHSGEMMTLPMMSDQYQWIDIIDGRNNYRAPAYHRLDLGMNFHPKKWRSPERYGEWNFGIYNAYNRMNVFRIYSEILLGNESQSINKKMYKITLFPILPSISYTYNF
jgi:outer membrane receptor for ferrienterochelin and colicin